MAVLLILCALVDKIIVKFKKKETLSKAVAVLQELKLLENNHRWQPTSWFERNETPKNIKIKFVCSSVRAWAVSNIEIVLAVETTITDLDGILQEPLTETDQRVGRRKI